MVLNPLNRSLDDWYLRVNSIFLDRNFYRDEFSIFAHLIEIVGGLSLIASDKSKPGVNPHHFVPKAIAWWMALCGKVGVRSVEDMIWSKFPSVCPYCRSKPHRQKLCQRMKLLPTSPDWKTLDDIGKQNLNARPRTLQEWLIMFSEIYPSSDVEQYPATFARFAEEIGELSEALRVFPVAPGYFLSEASDLFAWIMHLYLLMHAKTDVETLDQAQILVQSFHDSYPDRCSDCGNPVCTCPPILPRTLGRIAREVPTTANPFQQGGALLPAEEAIAIFQLGTRTVKIGDQDYEVDSSLVRDIHHTVAQLLIHAKKTEETTKSLDSNLAAVLKAIEDLLLNQRITNQTMDTVARKVASLPSDQRTFILSFLSNITAGPWVAALVKLVQHLAGS